MPLILEVERAYAEAQGRPRIPVRDRVLPRALCRPAHRRSISPSASPRHCGGAKIYLKREDLNHTGAHKINNTIGQILLARRMGKRRIIAETGAGQHGVATATVCALFDLPCVVYMGAIDIERQKPNVFRMKLLGAEVRAGPFRHRDLEGRDERGAARLGRQCRGHLLPHRHGRRTASLSGDGARFPDTSSARRCAPRCSAPKAGCPIRWWPASAAARTRWASSIPFLDEPSVRDDRRRGRRPRDRDRQARGLAQRRHARRAARQPHLSAAERPTGRSSTRIRSRRGSIIPASDPSMPGCTTGSGSNTSRSPMTRRSRPSSC